MLDTTNHPVPHATYGASFWASDSLLDVDRQKGTTDANGLSPLKGRTIHFVEYNFSKPGYYDTKGSYWFYHPNETCVSNGCWQPWGPTNTVVLKEHRNPIPMYVLKIRAVIPVRDKPIGYDMEVGDWTAPYGTGKVTDFWITYSADVPNWQNLSNRLVIAGAHPGDGFLRGEQESWSSFVTPYEAPLNGYLPEIAFSMQRKNGQTIKQEQFPPSEYLFVRSRTVLDEHGNISSAHYSKIYGPIEYGGQDEDVVRFLYFMNPTPNDRNMECDPEKNLMSGGQGVKFYRTP